MISAAQALPSVTLYEYLHAPTEGCAIGPRAINAAEAAQGKTVVIVGVPGAFTPTCSEKHLPGFIEQADALKKAGVDEIWCVAVNDAFVMGAWAQATGGAGKIRFMGDGSAEFAKATGLTFDLTAKGLGVRNQRYSMLIRQGKVDALFVEAPGQFEVSDAQSMLDYVRKGS